MAVTGCGAQDQRLKRPCQRVLRETSSLVMRAGERLENTSISVLPYCVYVQIVSIRARGGRPKPLIGEGWYMGAAITARARSVFTVPFLPSPSTYALTTKPIL